MFPVCELGKDSLLLCENDCIQVTNTCPQASYVNGSKLCDAASISSSRCFPLNYEGPNVGLWVVGFGIAVVFSFLASLGINLQKSSLSQHEESVPVIRQPKWMLGFFFIFMGSLLDFVAFGMAPQSLLAPLAALSLVWNMLMAPFFLKEKLDSRDLIATFVVFVGATLTVIFADHATPEFTIEILISLYKKPLMKIYCVVIPTFILGHYLLIKWMNRLRQTKSKAISSQLRRTLHMIGYAGLAGSMGGQSLLFAKSNVELIKSWMVGNNPWSFWQTYVLFGSLAICLAVQIHFLNSGLRLYDALSMVPVYQAYWIIMGVLGGLVYFEEILSFTAAEGSMFAFGVLLAVLGIIILSQRKQTTRKESMESTVDEAGFIRHVNSEVFDRYLDMTPRLSFSSILDDLQLRQDRHGEFLHHKSRMRSSSTQSYKSSIQSKKKGYNRSPSAEIDLELELAAIPKDPNSLQPTHENGNPQKKKQKKGYEKLVDDVEKGDQNEETTQK